MEISPSRPASVALGFSRFALVGSVGFMVDASLLTLLVNGFGLGHYVSRAVSFSAAVSVTWLANRRWTFLPTRERGREYGAYLLVQVLGALINLTIYVVVIELFASLSRVPIVPLACGATAALVFNFLATRRFVFSAWRGESPPGSFSAYSGHENLEAMEHARRYNGFLVALLRRHLIGPKVLDFGAGAGTFARPLASAGLRVTCVEPDDVLRAGLHEAGFETFENVSQVPLESCDSIYSLNVLEHVGDDVGTLRELRRRLRANGRIIIYVPAFTVLYSAMDRRVGHVRRYRRPELIAKLRATGYAVRSARYVDSLGFLVSLLYKLVGDSSGVVSVAAVRVYDRFVFPLSRLLDRATGGSFGKNLLVVADR